MPLDEPFSARIKRLREEASLSQEELAEKSGLSLAAIAAYESGKRRRPYQSSLRGLADALQVPVAYLRTGTEEQTAPSQPGGDPAVSDERAGIPPAASLV